MPQPWVTGPATIRIAGQELGTAERYPRYLIRSGWLPFFNDISGPVIPNDMLWAGKEAFIYGDINRWNEDVLQFYQSITESADPLSWDVEDVGSLMLHEGLAVPLDILFPYAGKAKYAGMPRGIRFFATWYEGPEEFATQGTTPRKVHLVAHALPVKNGGRWRLGQYL